MEFCCKALDQRSGNFAKVKAFSFFLGEYRGCFRAFWEGLYTSVLIGWHCGDGVFLCPDPKGWHRGHRKKFKVTTGSNHKYPVSSNLFDRKFNPGRLNLVWVSDITYIKTKKGWLYMT